MALKLLTLSFKKYQKGVWKMKKWRIILEGIFINAGFIVFGYLFLLGFCAIFMPPESLVSIKKL